MRKPMVIAVCLLVSTAAFAQMEKPNGLYVFVANPGYGHGANSSYWDAAFGLAVQRMFTPHISGEVSISRDRHYSRHTVIGPSGNTIATTTYSTPVDLTARYHFFTDGAWKPYAGTGVRWLESRAYVDLTGGVVWQFRPSLGLRFDGKVILGANQPGFSETFNAAAGLAWRF